MKITGQLSSIVIAMLVMFLGCGSNKAETTTSNNDGAEITVPAQQTNANTSNFNDQVGDNLGANNIKFSGTFTGSANTLVFLSELTTAKLIVTDTVRTDAKGRFEFNTPLNKTSLFFVTFDQPQPPGVPVVLGPGSKLTLHMEQGDFIKTKVKGDWVNDDMKGLYDIYIGHNQKQAEFNERVSKIDPATASAEQRSSIQKEYQQNQITMVKDIENFVSTHKGSLVSYFAATYIIPKTPISLTEKALAQMKKDAPDLAETTELQDRLDSVKPLDIGGKAPEISLVSPDGEEVKLSSLRGKVVLIDFWASWCGPCRRENPNVVQAYAKYKDKGFEIYGVSLDKDMRKWKYAIEKDGITWIQVSDLKGWSNVAAKRYKVSSIPQTFLLDREGRIIAKNLRGAALEAKLAEVLGES